MATLSVLTWIGNAAAVLLGRHGAITAQTAQAGCSRQAAYEHADRVQQAVTDAQEPGPSRGELLQQVQLLRDENRQLWDWLEEALEPSQDKQRQFTVTAAAMGLSLQQILALLAILLPRRRCPHRATLGRWVRTAGQRAGRVLALLDGACRGLVLCLCLDEIFFRRQPMLMGIEPFSMAWMLGQRAADRSGPTWAKALAAWPAVADVAVDGGSGLELGLKLAGQRRQEQAATAKTQAVPLRVRLDLFHTRREGGRASALDWRQAEARWQEAEKLERDKARQGRRGEDRRCFNGPLQRAWEVAVAALEEADGKEKAWARAMAALGVFRPDGQVNDRAWAKAELQAAAVALTGPRWAKARRMVLDERSLTFLDRLQEELVVAEARPQVREALVALWRHQRQRRRRGTKKESAAPAAAPAGTLVKGCLREVIRRELGSGWQESYRRVARVLRRVLRASSAVECVNSVVRMHQARHRNLTQELIDLKRLYWNCRSFVSGKRRGRCPYEHLGLRLPSYDPWELLQRDPQELAQQLSTPEVAA